MLLQTLVTAQWFYMLNCRVSDGFSLTKGLLANKGDLDRQRRTAAAAAADYLRAFYADAVRHHRAAVPLLLITFIISRHVLIVELEKPLTRKWRSA